MNGGGDAVGLTLSFGPGVAPCGLNVSVDAEPVARIVNGPTNGMNERTCPTAVTVTIRPDCEALVVSDANRFPADELISPSATA